MKKIILIVSTLGVITAAYGQSLDWAKQLVGTGNLFSRSMAIDDAGNVFTTGSFDDTLYSDTDTGYYPLASNGNKDIYLSKRSPKGALLWIHSIGAKEDDAGLSVAADSLGNVYISGYFSDTVDFDPAVGVVNLISHKWYFGVFVSKFDPSGNLIWAQQIGSGNIDFVTSMSVSKNGNLYLFGTFTDTVDFDPGPSVTQLYSSQGDNMFVAKYNAAGHLKWARNIESRGGNEPRAIYLDEMENVYITGSFSDTTDFDPGAGKYELMPYSYREDIFIEKLDSSGNFLWAGQFSGPEDAIAQDVTVDKNGNVYTTGSFTGKIDFDPGPDSTFLETDSTQNTDAFISKLNSTGQFIWVKKVGSFPYLEVGYSLVSDDIGNIYTTGVFNRTSDLQPGSDSIYISAGILPWEDIYLNKLDSQGNFLWTKQIGGNSSDFSSDITIDQSNHIYLTGHFHDDLDFDMSGSGYNLLCQVAWDGFIAKIDPTLIGVPETRVRSKGFPYPNPFEALLTFDLGHDYERVKVAMSDANGKVVLTKNYSNTDTIKMYPNVSPGMYIISIETNGKEKYFYKVIKK